LRRVEGGCGDVELFRAVGIPGSFGGASASAIPVAGRHADVDAAWGGTGAQVRALVAARNAERTAHQTAA
jgi:alkanesulfonate monooxygenase